MAMIALGGLVAFASMAKSQTFAATPASAVGRKAGGSHDRLKVLNEELQLTADQQAKLKPILLDEGQKLKTLHQDTNLSKQDNRAKGKAIREGTNALIKPILTPEQLEKWNKLQAEAPRKRRP